MVGLRRGAGRPAGVGRGASLSAKPCSFVVKHHVFEVQGAADVPDVVLRLPQTLVLSSSSTTSLGPKAPPAYLTWCLTPRNPLFFRRRAPRLWGPRRRRSAGRGAPLPAIPCSFVVKHHVFRAQGAGGLRDVVLRSPQSLVLSSSSTTSLASMAPPAYRTWCLTPRKTLFLRRRAPRLWGPRRRRRTRRGASLPAKSCSFVIEHHVFGAHGAAGLRDVVLRSPQSLVLSSSSTTSLAPKALPAYRTWCLTPRKTLFLRRRAPRLWRPRRRRRTGRGAPPPASPCSFVVKHHVFEVQGAADVPDVVLRLPRALVLSSSSTTSSGPKAPPAYRTWCSASRKPLFFRRQAPRLPSSRRRRSAGRGAPLPAIPCSFVVEHHVFGAQGAAGVPDVVPHSPQSLVLSSSSTTSLASMAPPVCGTWCSASREPLFFRRQAPRLRGPRRRRRTGRGAPPPASPCSFVVKHHVFRAQGAGGLRDVVLRSPQSLVLSSSSTTSLAPMAPPVCGTWCSAPCKPLFFRRQAPRLWRRLGRPPASHPKSDA